MNRQHKWVKHKISNFLIYGYGGVFDHRKCTKCGLEKTSQRIGIQDFKTIYFLTDENGKIIDESLSENILPYKCDLFAPMKSGKEQLLEDDLFEIRI